MVGSAAIHNWRDTAVFDRVRALIPNHLRQQFSSTASFPPKICIMSNTCLRTRKGLFKLSRQIFTWKYFPVESYISNLLIIFIYSTSKYLHIYIHWKTNIINCNDYYQRMSYLMNIKIHLIIGIKIHLIRKLHIGICIIAMNYRILLYLHRST